VSICGQFRIRLRFRSAAFSAVKFQLLIQGKLCGKLIVMLQSGEA
jgi:hypothetical protein